MLTETKVLRDPIHGYIHVEDELIWNLINTPEFQRLHRIHQLGGVFQVYHTAEHSRFAHSLGVYEISRRILKENQVIASVLSESQKRAIQCAALLHDLGHGPFSHFFETVVKVHHEVRTQALLKDEQLAVHQLLSQAGLLEEVLAILTKQSSLSLCHELISSPLDCDRMDYLLRDAYETGTQYGRFDLERILRTLRVHEGHLCVKASGTHSVEDYIMARYHMYWQVYLHPDAKAYELLIATFFKEYLASDCHIEALEVFRHPLDNQTFLSIDESTLFYGFHQASQLDHPVGRLARCILNRHLFKWIENPSAKQAQAIIEKYHWTLDEQEPASAYLPYHEEKEVLWILDDQGLKPLSESSPIVAALAKMDVKPGHRLYYLPI